MDLIKNHSDSKDVDKNNGPSTLDEFELDFNEKSIIRLREICSRNQNMYFSESALNCKCLDAHQEFSLVEKKPVCIGINDFELKYSVGGHSNNIVIEINSKKENQNLSTVYPTILLIRDPNFDLKMIDDISNEILKGYLKQFVYTKYESHFLVGIGTKKEIVLTKDNFLYRNYHAEFVNYSEYEYSRVFPDLNSFITAFSNEVDNKLMDAEFQKMISLFKNNLDNYPYELKGNCLKRCSLIHSKLPEDRVLVSTYVQGKIISRRLFTENSEKNLKFYLLTENFSPIRYYISSKLVQNNILNRFFTILESTGEKFNLSVSEDENEKKFNFDELLSVF